MTDYFSPTVVQSTIPDADMTLLERLLLTQTFESGPDGDGLYFFAQTLPNTNIELPVETVRAALAASEGVDSLIAGFVRDQLVDVAEGDSMVQLDFAQAYWRFIFQDIVRRSQTLKEVTIVTAFTCTKMRPDGFGGAAMFITADAIKSKSTDDILREFRNETAYGPVGGPPGSGVHVLLTLAEQDVRAEVDRLIAANWTLTILEADSITDGDIRAGCLFALEGTHLEHERDNAQHRAALAAIRAAERRLWSSD